MEWEDVKAVWPKLRIDERGHLYPVTGPSKGIFEAPLDILSEIGYIDKATTTEDGTTTIRYDITEKGLRYVSAFKRAIRVLYEEREIEIDFTPHMPFPMKRPEFITAGTTNYFTVPLLWAAGDEMANLPYTREEAMAAEKIALELMAHPTGLEELLERQMEMAKEWKESGEYLYGEEADKFMEEAT